MKKRLLSCLAFILALGASAQIELFKEINQGSGDAVGSSSSRFYVTNDGTKVYFQADNGTDGSELWVSDGTAAGTVQIMDLDGTSANSYPNTFHEFKNTQYFFNYLTKEMWQTDGTEAGTIKVAALDGYGYNYFTMSDDKIYFVDTNTGRLLEFDGSTVTTNSYYDGINEEPYISDLFYYNNKVYCYARMSSTQSTTGTEPYVYDPSANTFSLFLDIHPEDGRTASLNNFFEYNGLMYFTADNGTMINLYQSDGTVANTKKVTALESYYMDGPVYEWQDRFYFEAHDANDVDQLFVYNISTSEVTQLSSEADNFDAFDFVAVDNYLYIRGKNESSRTYSSSDRRLFRTSGSTPETVTFELVDPDSTLDIDWVGYVNGVIMLGGDDDCCDLAYGRELFWVNPAAITYSEVLSTAKPLSEVARVYPNPATDYLMMPNKLMNAPYSIYDITGRAVKSGVISSERLNFNLNTGLYILKVEVDSASYTQKIMVRK